MKDGWITQYLEYTHDTEPCRLYRKWAAISTIAAVLQRRVWYPLPGNDQLFPNMFVALVGPPAARKSTALRPVKRFLRALEVPISADTASQKALLHDLAQAVVKIEDQKGESISYAFLSAVLSEIRPFLGPRQHNEEMLKFLCQLFDCDSSIDSTIRHGKIVPPNPALNVIGGMTRSDINTVFHPSAFESGLPSRILFVFARKPGRKVAEELHDSTFYEKYEELLFNGLSNMQKWYGPFNQKNPSWRYCYKEWYENMEQTTPPHIRNHPRFHGYMGRRQTHLLKLAMVACANRFGFPDLNEHDFYTALGWLEETEARVHHCFESSGRNELIAGITQIFETILKAGPSGLPVSNIIDHWKQDYNNNEIGEILNTLRVTGLVYSENGQHQTIYKPTNDALKAYAKEQKDYEEKKHD